FPFAYALNDALLGSHRGGATELGEVDGLLEHVADFEALVVDLRILDRNLPARIGDLGNDAAEAGDLDPAAPLVDLDLGLHRWTVAFGEGGEDAVLQQQVQLGSIELFGIRDLFDRAQKIDGADHRELPSLTM